MLVGLSIFVVAQVAHSAPGTVLSTPAPFQGKAPDKIREITSEDATVSTQTGAFQYSFPIVVPPGRLGVEPKIALSYSSQGAIYGGLAAGWTISGLHEIKVDTSRGVREPTGWVSSMAGNRRLIPVEEAHPPEVAETFRAQNDASFARYRKMVAGHPFGWEVQTPDGWTYRLGELDHMAYTDPKWFPLTSARDEYGNRIDYYYNTLVGSTTDEQLIDRIEYSANDNAGLAAHAKVDFGWVNAPLCSGSEVPIGAQLTYRDGTKRIIGSGKLTGIVTYVRDTPTSEFRNVRKISFSYTGNGWDGFACQDRSQGSPLRLLHTISEQALSPSGYGDTYLPTITFDYGPRIPTGFVTSPNRLGLPSSGHNPSGTFANIWGYRPPPDGPHELSTLESTIVDVDGDGGKDALWVDFDSEASETSDTCVARWATTDGVSYPIQLPMVDWFNGSTMEAREDCSLTGQLTFRDNTDYVPPPECGSPGSDQIGSYYFYRFLDVTADGLVDVVGAIHHDLYYDPLGDLLGELPSCTGDGACPHPAQACLDDADECRISGGCSLYTYEHMVEDCFANAPEQKACHDHMAETESFLREDDDGDGQFCSIPYRQPFSRCGRYVWVIYENLGGGTFSSSPQYIYSPIPLESDTGDSPIVSTKGGFASTVHAFIDLDGDGALDAILANSGVQDFWSVWWGDGSGGFVGKDGSDAPDLWYAPEGIRPSSGVSGGEQDWATTGLTSLVDVNGDGLPDLVHHEAFTTNLRVYYNERTGFSENFVVLTADLDRVSLDVAADYETADPYNPEHITAANLLSRIRPFDYDVDGRIDWITRGVGQDPSPPKALLNLGATLASTLDMTDPMWSEAHEIQAFNEHWEVKDSYIDINGDGIYDEFDGDRSATINGHPPRLLHAIDSGRGAITRIRYASSVDSNVVTSDPSTGRAMPNSTWVVDTLTVENAYGPEGTWTYRYFYPEWNADAEDNFGFRGFDRVETTSPLGAVTVAKFDYSLDYSGRQVATEVYETAADRTAGLPTTISDTTWQTLTLFDTDAFSDDLVTYHPIVERTITCSAGQSYADCLANAPRRITEMDFLGLPTATPPVLYKSRMVRDRTTDVDELMNPGDHQDNLSYHTFITESAYRVRRYVTTRYEWSGENSTIKISRKSNHYHNNDLLYLNEEHVSVGPATNLATTKYTYDTATGKVLSRIKPEQYAGPDNSAETYEYGPFMIHVSAVINELGHRVEKDVDLGTGALLETRGPNGPFDCDFDLCAPAQGTRYTIDGFGRVRTREVAIDTDPEALPDGPTWQLVEKTTYFDTELPQRVRSETRIDYGGTAWITVDERYDGLGQLLSKTTPKVAPEVDVVFSYGYDATGNLVSFTMPDPSADNETDPSTVTYTYSYDNLGRLEQALRPDGSGTSIAYDGLVTTTTEIAATGPIATTVYTKDPFGRIIEVRERLDDGSDAVTTYGYDGNDNLNFVQNADGIITEMTHDWVGNRTTITRAGRTWQYDYDRNGNVIRIIAPVPAGADPLLYTTSIVYDDLDRVESKLPGLRTLSAAEQELYGTGLIDYTYDQGDNGVGRLTSVTLPGRTISYTYDELGRVLTETRGFDLTGMVKGPGHTGRPEEGCTGQTGGT